ncbi:MAG: FKBP-type peptidyl-prolyl cis-trans isomerase [Myxococcota bacterium]
MSETVSANKVVTLSYVLTNKAGEELDRSKEGAPLRYLHGARNIVPGLERQLEGKAVGDAFEAQVPAAEGYGAKQKVKPIRMPRSRFPQDADIKKGTSFQTQTRDGRAFPLWVTKVQGNTIVCTPLHPLTGVDLHFAVEILEIRDGSEEEIARGFVQGSGDDGDEGSEVSDDGDEGSEVSDD